MDSLVSEDVVLGFTCQLSENEWICNHVVDVVTKTDTSMTGPSRSSKTSGDVLAVGEVIERALLVDDAHGGLLCSDANALDVITRLAHGLELVVKDVRGFDGSLRVELGRIRDLEEHVLHDVGRVRHLELEGLALR